MRVGVDSEVFHWGTGRSPVSSILSCGQQSPRCILSVPIHYVATSSCQVSLPRISIDGLVHMCV